MDRYNTLTFTFDANKLLVPTPGKDSTDILTGSGSNKSPIAGIFSSFSDAPGGMKEEFKEINFSVGAEYWYNKQFALRTGYFYEHPTKGNRKYFTMGAGLKYTKFRLDLSYLIPTEQHNPLENTLRFSMILDLDNLKSKDTGTTTP